MATQGAGGSHEGGNPSPRHKPHHVPQSRRLAEATTDSKVDGGREKWKDQQKPRATPKKTALLSGHAFDDESVSLSSHMRTDEGPPVEERIDLY